MWTVAVLDSSNVPGMNFLNTYRSLLNLHKQNKFSKLCERFPFTKIFHFDAYFSSTDQPTRLHHLSNFAVCKVHRMQE